ncbi:MAG: glycoside hydrolase family 15 protein [Mycobacteriales bacterium]
MVSRIEDYALLGDLQTAALVGRDGSIDWLCFPHFDSPACFAALLGSTDNGLWRLAPAAGGEATRRGYRGDTLVLETVWETPEGTVRVVDCMPPRGEAPDVVRVVEGISGRVPMHSELRLRFDYGRVVPWVRQVNGQLVAVAGPDSAWLSTPAPLAGRDLTTHSEFSVGAGERVPFVLTWHPSWKRPPKAVDPYQAVDDTESYWAEWMAKATYDGGWQSEVRRSLVVLKALTFQPTGGIVAAATTSLPEQLGGVRNWDYRYCWLRDAALTLQALLGAGFKAEAGKWRDWLLRAVAGDPADLQIMYGIDGTRRLPEFRLDWLAGYENSRPVRIGNAASEQLQLDVWGETLDGLSFSREARLSRNDDAWALQKRLLEFLEGAWREPDNGLWEMRGPRRDFVHSKVMAWVAFDRMVTGVEHFGLQGPVDRWRRTRDEIKDEVLAKGYDGERNTFTQAYGSTELDAALLLIPQVRFLPWTDPRVAGTVRAVQRELCEDGFVLRYRPGAGASDDGLPGDEGAFLACSFWLADALHGIGEQRQATEMLEKLMGLANDVGLLAEEYDPRLGRQLGNTPQAFSHLGLVNAARHLSGARSAAPRLRQPRMAAS